MPELAALPDAIWDAVIVGAGPAGSASAARLAERGWKVLLTEKSSWPRSKACGGCVNAEAISTLRRMNLQSVLRGASQTHLARFTQRKSGIEVPSGGRAIDRATLDQRLVDAAVERGAVFLFSTTATLTRNETSNHVSSACRAMTLRDGHTCRTIQTRLILAADGINGTLLRDEPWARWHVARDAWMGVDCTLKPGKVSVASGAIEMKIGSGGYVGLVQQADGRVHLGAALDPRRSQKLGGPRRIIERILRDNGLDASIDEPLNGTGLLTRQRRALGADRVLCVGDACGYVEPLTGEGIAWALASAEAATGLLPDDLTRWSKDLPERWKALHRQTVGRRQRVCRLVRYAAHRPWLWRIAAAFARCAPAAVAWAAPMSGSMLPQESHD